MTAKKTKTAPIKAPEGDPAPLVDPAKVPNMTKTDINEVSADGLDEDSGPKRDMAEGLAQASDRVNTPEPEMHPFRSGPGSDIA